MGAERTLVAGGQRHKGLTALLRCLCRAKSMGAERARVAGELEAASEEFRAFERQDIKFREDLKHLKAKVKKLQDKLARDETKLQVGWSMPLACGCWAWVASTVIQILPLQRQLQVGSLGVSVAVGVA